MNKMDLEAKNDSKAIFTMAATVTVMSTAMIMMMMIMMMIVIFITRPPMKTFRAGAMLFLVLSVRE